MYLHNKNVIFITICLIFWTVYAESSEECAELIVDETKSVQNQNKINCLQKNSKEKRQIQADSLLDEDAGKYPELLNFLTKKSDLSILNIANDNNGNGVNVLKEAAGFTVVSKTQDEKTDSGSEYQPVATTVANIPMEAYETTTSFTKDKDLADFHFLYTNNQNAVDILKAAASSFVNSNTDKIIDEQNDSVESASKYDDNLMKLLNTSSSVTTKKQTSTANQLHGDEILLSEIVNLSANDEETLTLGQKIIVESSNVSSVAADNNSPGSEILRNMSITCGSLFGKRISFANETTLMEFPWTALLLYNTKVRYHCGGSLITEKYVLTAAHCVAQEFYELTGVRLGEHDVSEPVDCAPDVGGDTICANTVDAGVVKIIVHHQYSHISFKNDIALLRLDKEYNSRSFYPICLPMADMMNAETTATVAGWGATEKTIRSTVLLKADVPIYDISKCREVYSYTKFNDSTEMCGSGANEVDVCKGDSGGALFVNRNVNGKEKFYQLGIISLGVRRCGDSRFLPAVFTKLTGFYNWIENNLEY